MKKKLLLLVATTFLYIATYAQTPSDGGAFQHFGLSLKAGAMNGVGLDLSTSLHPNLTTRIGFNYLGYDVAKIIENSTEQELDQGKLNFANANILLDYYPVQNGVFHITAGAFFGSNKVVLEGSGFDPFSLNDYVIVTDANGYFKSTVKFGGVVKPYFGLGIGRTIPKKTVGVKFEMGVVYQGKLTAESDYLNTSMKPSDMESVIEIPLLESKFWPSATLSLVFRLK